MTDDDDGARVGLWVALGVVGLLILSLVGALAWNAADEAAAPAKPAAAVAAADAVLDVPLSGDLIGKLYFDVAKAEVSADSAAALEQAVQAAQAAAGKKLVLSGFHDLSGDPAKNAELAKERAKSVREALKAKGLSAERIMLRKPEQTAVDGPAEEARRVEIRLVEMP